MSVNGHDIADVLDYRFYTDEPLLELSLLDENGSEYSAVIHKRDRYADIGLEFATYLMDSHHSCKNNCIFCFIDQLPRGMRDSLYFKDDDSRLSFLFGNYVTLTNLSEREIERIIEMHISPVNVSVHTMNPELRVMMMRNRFAGESLKILERLASAGTKLNTQLVLCPGINDGDELAFSLNELGKLYPSVISIACVPVGLTSHRDGLYKIEPYTAQTAARVIDIIDNFNAHFTFFNKCEPIAYPADEFYLIAGREIPDSGSYGDYNQLENGVGMSALMKEEFYDALEQCEAALTSPRAVTVATGSAAYPLMCELCSAAAGRFPLLKPSVIEVKNDFFGHSVTVAGLVTGQDYYKALSGKKLGQALLIPAVSLKRGENVFLDDMTLTELSEKLGVPVIPVSNDGAELLNQLLFAPPMKG